MKLEHKTKNNVNINRDMDIKYSTIKNILKKAFIHKKSRIAIKSDSRTKNVKI